MATVLDEVPNARNASSEETLRYFFGLKKKSISPSSQRIDMQHSQALSEDLNNPYGRAKVSKEDIICQICSRAKNLGRLSGSLPLEVELSILNGDMSWIDEVSQGNTVKSNKLREVYFGRLNWAFDREVRPFFEGPKKEYLQEDGQNEFIALARSCIKKGIECEEGLGVPTYLAEYSPIVVRRVPTTPDFNLLKALMGRVKHLNRLIRKGLVNFKILEHIKEDMGWLEKSLGNNGDCRIVVSPYVGLYHQGVAYGAMHGSQCV